MTPETDAKRDGRPARFENLTLWQRVYEYLREEILAVTFTDKEAGELRARLDRKSVV